MKYPVSEISLLIDLMLVKAKLPRVYKGLRELSERIEDEQDIQNRTKKKNEYLYNVHNEKIANALVKQEKEIKVSVDYLNEYLTYLGYEDYQSFREQYQKVKKQLDKLNFSVKEWQFLIPKSSKNKLLEKIENSFYPGQELSYGVEDFDDTKEWEERLIQNQEETAFVWFIPPAFFKSKSLYKTLENNRENSTILVWLTDKLSEINHFKQIVDVDKQLFLDELRDDLCLLIQLLIALERKSEKKKKSKTKQQLNKTIIKNEVGNNQGFVIGQLKSKHAPQIQNHYYGTQSQDDEN